MNDTLKAAGRIGAELGAAKAENDRLREVLSRIANLPMYQCSTENDYRLSAAKAMAVGALTHQADQTETTEAYTALDMATAAAQGFRDGQVAVEQATAQDETEPVYQFQWREIGEGDWMACSHSWFRFCEASPEHDTRVVEVARPAQTEQQPVQYTIGDLTYARVFKAAGLTNLSDIQAVLDAVEAAIAQLAPQTEQSRPANKLRALAEIWDQNADEADEFGNAQAAEALRLAAFELRATLSAPQGKFRMGDLVKKSTGSEWEGRVVGWYSTEQTPEGYAVESSAHRNSVQIYPAKALEAVE